MFDRAELRKVLENAAFKNFLELVPQVRELINDFYGSRYASCLKYLEELRVLYIYIYFYSHLSKYKELALTHIYTMLHWQPDLELDLHLHDHVESLYQKIRNKAIVQYFSPFVSVDMQTMAQAFNTDVASLEKELSGLIMEGSIQARIDSHNKVLYARTTNQRSVTFERALRVGEDYQNTTRAMLFRVNLMKNDFIVRPPRTTTATQADNLRDDTIPPRGGPDNRDKP